MKSKGFSLIELIVVISIVAMLLALALSVSRRAREQARTVVCQSNMRQLLLQFRQYDSEHGTMPYGFTFRFDPPPPGSYAADLRFDAPGWYWPNYIGTIRHKGRRDLKLLECPAKHLEDDRLQGSPLSGNYGVNRSICRSGRELSPKYDEAFGGTPISSNMVRHPGQTLLLVDSGYALICWWQARDDPLMALNGEAIADTAYIPGLSINKDRELWPAQIDDAVGGRHPGKTVNVGFVDGHSERKKAQTLLVRRTDEDAYNNRAPLWEPD